MRRFLAVGGPGCCLVKVVLGNLVAVRLFHYSSGWDTSHPCAISKISWRASAHDNIDHLGHHLLV